MGPDFSSAQFQDKEGKYDLEGAQGFEQAGETKEEAIGKMVDFYL